MSSKTPANEGAFARGIANGVRKTLLTGPGNYKGFVFDDAGAQAAFVSDRDDAKAPAPRYKLYHWTTTGDAATELPLPASAADAGQRQRPPRVSKDGTHLFFGTAPPRAAEPDETADLIKVDIWNYKDAELQPMQKVRAEQELKRTYRAVFHLADKRFVQLATSDMPDVRINDSATQALGVSNVPYRQLVSWDGNYDDYYLVKLADGSRKKILDKEHFGATVSPGGKLHPLLRRRRRQLVHRARQRRPEDEHHQGARREVPERDRRSPRASDAVRTGRLDRRRQHRPALRPLRHLGSASRRQRRRGC